MITTATIGFPRIGPKRNMKSALESFWNGKSTSDELLSVAREVELSAWCEQADAGIEKIALDGTLYDHVLDFASMFGLIPDRFVGLTGLERYFACARGANKIEALDMSKYFDTNYHYLTPEMPSNWTPADSSFEDLLARVRRGIAAVGAARAVPLLLGPLTLASLTKGVDDIVLFVKSLTGAYGRLLDNLRDLGVSEVQIHEPILCTSFAEQLLDITRKSYSELVKSNVPIHVVIPYDDVTEEVYVCVTSLPIAGAAFDFCGVPGASTPNQMCSILLKHGFPKDKRLGVGIVDGRAIWSEDVEHGETVKIIQALQNHLGEGQEICIQTSTSLQHVPYDVRVENHLPPGLKGKLSFATQKLHEITAIAKRVSSKAACVDASILGIKKGFEVDDSIIDPSLTKRSEPYEERRRKQKQYSAFPTTTIGSFPQTSVIRKVRLQYKRGQITETEYKQAIASQIAFAIGVQEGIGLDVFVHGEAERSDMVEYFGLKLHGLAFTEYGWVQSYGSRYVRPPIVYDDVVREGPMTIHEFQLAQALTEKPVKGMLTGPVTILNWSFPRKDISRSKQALQIAKAIREEVDGLQNAGCSICQVDEPALREGLPLKSIKWRTYLEWSTAAFKVSTSVARPEVQIVTHLCYSEFKDIMEAIDWLDADVLTIENSRSSDEMIHELSTYGYSRDIGPGVYDVHSPVVPSVEFMTEKILSFWNTGILGKDASRIHVNPDCGLKTRKWPEVIQSLRNMVQAAQIARRRAVSDSEA